jgi:pimeloyl-ACP methyl ester carboxylesterase
VSLLRHGFHFRRTALSRFFTLFPFRPQTLLTIEKSPVKHLTYWHRQHTSKTKLPILFIHGIGIGLYPYIRFLSDLNSADGLEDSGPDDQVGIIAIEIMPVSFRITHSALSKSEMCAEIEAILAHHGWDKVVLVSHSYGTVVSTHLLKTPSTSHLIGPIVLIDPVSILLHLPDTAYNFKHRKPKRANEHQLYYFASMDMGVSHTLSRHFFWFENVLWKEDIEGRNATVSLARKDLIVDTEAVSRYLTSGNLSRNTSTASSTILIDAKGTRDDEAKLITGQMREVVGEDAEEAAAAWKESMWKGKGIDMLWFDNLDHGQVFERPATRRPLVRAIRGYCAQEVPRSNGA